MEEFALRCSQTANGVVTLWGPNSRSRGNHCRLRSETRDETELFQLCEHARNWDRAAWIVHFAQTKSSTQTSSYKLDTKTRKPASGPLQVLLRFFGAVPRCVVLITKWPYFKRFRIIIMMPVNLTDTSTHFTRRNIWPRVLVSHS